MADDPDELKRQKMHGRPVTREEVYAQLGDPSTWEADQKRLEEEQRRPYKRAAAEQVEHILLDRVVAGDAVCKRCGHKSRQMADSPVAEPLTVVWCGEVGRTHLWVPDTSLKENGQQKGYSVLSADERAAGFVRPVRREYLHLKCGTTTTMSQPLAETYARQPDYYTGTFCSHCRGHFPVGADGEFVWMSQSVRTTEKVGT